MALELLRNTHHQKTWPQLLRVGFDLAFVALIFSAVKSFDLPWVALSLVVLSKWRMFMVRPRFWWTNVLSNLTDMIFGIGFVILIWMAGSNEIFQVAFTLLYAIWQIFVKPKSGRVWIMTQAAIAQLVGIWAIFATAHLIPTEISLPVVILLCFIVGFSVARHVFLAIREDSRDLLSLAWGLVIAELGFIGFHWTIAYSIFGMIKIPQIAIIDLALAYLAGCVYNSYLKNEKIKWVDIRYPLIFVILFIVILLVVYSGLLDATQL